jgi:hypothetical protein
MKKLLIILTLSSCLPSYDVEYNEYTCEKMIISLDNNLDPVDTSYDYTNYRIKDTAITQLENTMKRCLESSDTVTFGGTVIFKTKWIKN